MNEAETRAEHIDPALRAAGWGVVEGSRVMREYRITEGLAQAKAYADKLHARFTYATNGQRIYGVDMQTGIEGDVAAYSTPDELWNLAFPAPVPAGPTTEAAGAVVATTESVEAWRERFAAVPFADKGGSWQIRFYQEIAVNSVLEAITASKQRILLTLATGTGKTSIAFQIAWKLFQTRWSLNGEPTRRPRILFLADRNTLATQAFNDFNSFSTFPEDALVRIKPDEIRRKGRVPTNGSVFFTIFQTFMSGPSTNTVRAVPVEAPDDALRQAQGERSYYFGDYPPDFFDFIVIDECHRGGANDESTWRGILDYFSPAVQLGLTATLKRRDNTDTYTYFGEPVYVYSLKDGINDGFLTPFRVKQYATTLDDYRYTSDDQLVEGEVEAGKLYEEKDFNRIIEIEAREKYRVQLFMDSIDPNYCVRVTANDGERGDQFLRDFQDNENSIPTILTTSQKLTTGVDARNVRNIVLMRPVNSMIEFKQIIGRGTRLYDGKDYFTIYDFVKAHKLFNDDDWDGPPDEPTPCKKCERYPCVCVREAEPACYACGKQPCECEKSACSKCSKRPCECTRKARVKLRDGKERSIRHISVTTFWGPDGTPISAAEFLTLLFGQLPEFFKNEDELRALWCVPETRQKLLEGLAEKGYGKDQLAEMQKIIDAENSDLFDMLAHVAFAMQPLTRADRADAAYGEIHQQFSDKQQAFLDFVLVHYVQEGVEELGQDKLTKLLRLKYHDSIPDAVADLGGDIGAIRNLFSGFQRYLYQGNVGAR